MFLLHSVFQVCISGLTLLLRAFLPTSCGVLRSCCTRAGGSSCLAGHKGSEFHCHRRRIPTYIGQDREEDGERESKKYVSRELKLNLREQDGNSPDDLSQQNPFRPLEAAVGYK